MRIALGVLRWPPNVFWNATIHEFVAAYEGMQGEFGQDIVSEAKFKKLFDEVVKADGKNN